MENKEIQCEYCTVRSNENKCKALGIEFHNCLNILEQKKCPIYKLKQQLKSKEWECENLKQWQEDAENLFKTQTDNADKIINRHKQTLDEIEEFCTVYSNNHDAYETVYKFILSIINKAKGNEKCQKK